MERDVVDLNMFKQKVGFFTIVRISGIFSLRDIKD